MILFSSDFHLGHNVIVPKYRNFKSQEEHDALILDNMSKLHKKDILYILGDFVFDSDKYDYYINELSKMSCRIKLIMGNHDSLKLYKENRLPKLELHQPLLTYKKMWLSHCPIHPQEMRNRILNIHGHLHGHKVETSVWVNKLNEYNTPKYFNVCLDNNNFEFVNFEYIKEITI